MKRHWAVPRNRSRRGLTACVEFRSQFTKGLFHRIPSYQVSTTGGASWATVVLSRGLITDIEAFYTFDPTGHLADLRVRITHDVP
jgi:hypothetical protein